MDDATHGDGWVVFAGIMVLVAGVLNCIYGIAAIDNADFFIEDQRFIFSDLATWGWIILIIGSVQLVAAMSIFAGNELGRWIGLVSASIGAIGALLTLPGYPFYSLAVFSIDILVVYGLAAYGGRREQDRLTWAANTPRKDSCAHRGEIGSRASTWRPARTTQRERTRYERSRTSAVRRHPVADGGDAQHHLRDRRPGRRQRLRQRPRFIFTNLNTLGWWLIILGIIQLTGGFSLLAGNTYGRVIGIAAGSLGAIGALLAIGGAYPWWSLAIFALCIYVVYGLIVYGEPEPGEPVRR